MNLMFFISSGFADEKAVQAQAESKSEEEEEISCTLYSAKREAVPVYRSPDKSTEVLAKLSLGEELCYIGEQDGFAIIDWEKTFLRREAAFDEESQPELVFVSLTDLWPPMTEVQSIEEHARRVFENMGYGGQPEDVFAPLRELIYKITGGPKCLAGSICEKVERELEKGDE